MNRSLLHFIIFIDWKLQHHIWNGHDVKNCFEKRTHCRKWRWISSSKTRFRLLIKQKRIVDNGTRTQQCLKQEIKVYQIGGSTRWLSDESQVTNISLLSFFSVTLLLLILFFPVMRENSYMVDWMGEYVNLWIEERVRESANLLEWFWINVFIGFRLTEFLTLLINPQVNQFGSSHC